MPLAYVPPLTSTRSNAMRGSLSSTSSTAFSFSASFVDPSKSEAFTLILSTPPLPIAFLHARQTSTTILVDPVERNWDSK